MRSNEARHRAKKQSKADVVDGGKNDQIMRSNRGRMCVKRRTYGGDDEDDPEGVDHGRHREGQRREHLAKAARGRIKYGQNMVKLGCEDEQFFLGGFYRQGA